VLERIEQELKAMLDAQLAAPAFSLAEPSTLALQT